METNALEHTRPLKAFMLHVSATEFKGNPRQLNEFISQNRLVESWWNYVPYLYALTSRSDTFELVEAFVKFIGKKTDFVVAEINASQTAGFITAGAWEPFNKDVRDRVRSDREARS